MSTNAPPALSNVLPKVFVEAAKPVRDADPKPKTKAAAKPKTKAAAKPKTKAAAKPKTKAAAKPKVKKNNNAKAKKALRRARINWLAEIEKIESSKSGEKSFELSSAGVAQVTAARLRKDFGVTCWTEYAKLTVSVFDYE